MIHILLVDDHQISLEGTQKWLQKTFKENLICHATTKVRQAYHFLETNPINLAILDLELNNERKTTGFDLATYIKKEYPKIKIIAFTNYCTYRVLQKALDSGFNAFLSKNISFNEFSKGIKSVLLSDDFVSSCQKKIIENRKVYLNEMFKDSLYGLSLLTPKLIEVLQSLPKTTNRQELATLLDIAPHTIDTHIKKLREKLSLSCKQDLVLFALEFKNEINKLSNLTPPTVK